MLLPVPLACILGTLHFNRPGYTPGMSRWRAGTVMGFILFPGLKGRGLKLPEWVLAVIDCRPLLQGWLAVEALHGLIPCEEIDQVLSTSAPPGWTLYLERLRTVGDAYQVDHGGVAYASFVPIASPAAIGPSIEQAESEAQTADAELHSGSDDDTGAGVGDLRPRGRSRTPRRDTTAADIVGRAGPVDEGVVFGASFFILTPEYVPELVKVALEVGSSVREALREVDRLRDRHCRMRFPDLVAAEPQPSLDFAVCVATPAWTQDTFIAVDALRLIGTLFCAFVQSDVDRETLLATAGFPSVPTIEVYVPGQQVPLQPRQRIQLASGDCVPSCPFLGLLLSSPSPVWGTDYKTLRVGKRPLLCRAFLATGCWSL